MLSRSKRRHLPSRLAVAFALVLPASAIAAPDVDRSGRGAERADAAPGAAAFLAGVGAGIALEPAREPTFNPVDAPIDYGTATNTFGGGGLRTHEGQDMFAPEGTPLVSPVPTTVIETGSDGGRGNWAALYDAAQDRTFIYLHMVEPAAASAGQDLAAGETIGLLGCTGSCDGAHLHFELRDGRGPYGPARDPLPTLQNWQRP